MTWSARGSVLFGLLVALGVFARASVAVEPKAPDTPKGPYNPQVAAASEEPQKAIARIRVPAEFKVDVFAAEPHLANPVAFGFDERGRCFVAETFRHHSGVTDARHHMYWLDEDLASRTVADRIAMYKKHKKFEEYGREHDRVRLIEDRDGDGKADFSSVFADGFHQAEAGIGSSVLARRGRVWYACIPSLWSLRDSDGDGKAEIRDELSTGYGVHVGFLGHDLHGLIFGPDGKLYFTIGDRGAHVQPAHGKPIDYTDAGAVFRCNPDGTGLELFATGLRNPQELAFDEYGNLFTCDNNSDSGDRARWVHLVEGGDSGWRIGYQFMTRPIARGPWNAELLWDAAKQWDVNHPYRAAYILPPLANLSDGPSGLAYDPGTGLSDRYRQRFFLADFRGDAGRSGIRTFGNAPRGATFSVVDQTEFVWQVLATDVDFGPDGGLYVLDWVEGWNKTGKGRLFRVTEKPQPANGSRQVAERLFLAAEVKRLLAEDLTVWKLDRLAPLLAHPDQRVRQAAQFAFADEGPSAAPLLAKLATEPMAAAANDKLRQLARVHAIWAIGQTGGKPLAALVPLLSDGDAEVRAQAARVLGETVHASAAEPIAKLLNDPSPRVQLFASLALSKLGHANVLPAVWQFVERTGDADPYLRHGAVMCLARLAKPDELAAKSKDANESVRLAAVVALRRQANAGVAQFLDDASPRVVLEAARAITDVPIAGALPQLAALAARRGLADMVTLRALAANFRLGGPEHAAALAAVASSSEASEMLRGEALDMLGQWEKPDGKDRIVGLWRPIAPRSKDPAVAALRPALGGILTGPNKVREAGVGLAAKYGIKEVGADLFAQLRDDKASPAVRAAALRALDALKDARVREGMQLALADVEPQVRAAGRAVLAKIDPAAALPALTKAVEKGETSERQAALATLATLNSPDADQVLAQWVDKLVAGEAPPELTLDLLEAASNRKTADLPKKLKQFEAARKADAVGKYVECVSGGDAERGQQIFFERAQVSCVRCHKVTGRGGEVGPDLSDVGAKQKREYILEALVEPNKAIAKGFDTVILETSAGKVITGVLREETPQALKLVTPEGTQLVIPKSEIESQSKGKSAMPDTLIQHLSKRDLRDLVEYLSTQRAAATAK